MCRRPGKTRKALKNKAFFGIILKERKGGRALKGQRGVMTFVPRAAGAQRVKTPRVANRSIALRCLNDRMEPTIPQGSTVFVREQPGVKDGDLAAVYWHGEYMIKRLHQLRDCVMLTDDAPGSVPMYCYPDDGCLMIGKAVAIMQYIR